jgi:hypothetical protein
MSRQIVDVGHSAHRRHELPLRCQRMVAVLVVGLALVVMSCGTETSSPGGQATATVKSTPSVTATPVPCSTWRIVSSPNATQYQHNDLLAVSAASPAAAWAVGGSFTDGLAEQTLIEQWDGAAWHLVATTTPPTPPTTISLSSVVALSPSDVWVVGYNRTPRQEGRITLVQHWDGTQWSTVPNPNPTQPNYFDLSVAAVGSNDVWVVGQFYNAADRLLPLAERWDGTAWKIVATPALPGVTESLFNAAAHIPGTQQLWAVGYALKGPRPAYEQPLIERWNGMSWQVVGSPTLPNGAFGGKLRGVVALSATDAWAVGEYTASDHTIRTLIVHWDGTSWTVAASPDTWGSLSGVAAAGAQDVRAVGHLAIGDSDNQHALIEQWNGSTWTVVTTPEPSGAANSGLSSIASDGAGGYWAVGAFAPGGEDDQTLTEHCP